MPETGSSNETQNGPNAPDAPNAPDGLGNASLVHHTRPLFLIAAMVIAALGMFGPFALIGVAGLDTKAMDGVVRLMMSGGMFLSMICMAIFANPSEAADKPLSVDAEGVHLGDKRVARRSSIRGALLASDPGGARLLLERGTLEEPVELIVDSLDRGHAVLRALGFDPAQTTATIPLRSFRTKLAAAVSSIASIGTLALAQSIGGLTLALSLAALVPLVIAAWIALVPRVTVGRDGVRVRGQLGTRFVPMPSIVDVSSSPRGVEIALAGGEMYVIPVGARKDMIVARIRQAIGDAAEGPLVKLARDGRTAADWLMWVRGLADGKETFREAAVTREELLRVVEAPRAPVEERAVAAAALAPHVDAAQRARFRALAEACASPRLRVALTAAADADEEAMEEALASLHH